MNISIVYIQNNNMIRKYVDIRQRLTNGVYRRVLSRVEITLAMRLCNTMNTLDKTTFENNYCLFECSQYQKQAYIPKWVFYIE